MEEFIKDIKFTVELTDGRKYFVSWGSTGEVVDWDKMMLTISYVMKRKLQTELNIETHTEYLIRTMSEQYYGKELAADMFNTPQGNKAVIESMRKTLNKDG